MPHLSITVALGLVLADLGVLIYFIHHVAKSIQLPEVIAGIASTLANEYLGPSSGVAHSVSVRLAGPALRNS